MGHSLQCNAMHVRCRVELVSWLTLFDPIWPTGQPVGQLVSRSIRLHVGSFDDDVDDLKASMLFVL